MEGDLGTVAAKARATQKTMFASKPLTVQAVLPSKGIGPIALKAIPAGPGHYILNSAVLSPAGDWQLEVTDRVSEFEQHSRTIDVPIR